MMSGGEYYTSSPGKYFKTTNVKIREIHEICKIHERRKMTCEMWINEIREIRGDPRDP